MPPALGATPAATAGASGIPSYMDILGQVMGQQAPQFNSSMLSSLFPQQGNAINAFTSAENQANQANLTRRNQAAGLINQQYQNDQNQGASQKQDVAQQLQQTLGSQKQDAINRGLNNSTVVNNLASGATREANRQDQRIDEGVTGMQNSALGSLANLLTSQTDQAPNMNSFASLLSQAAQQQAQRNAPRATGTNIIQSPNAGPGANSVFGGGAGATAGGVNAAGQRNPNQLMRGTNTNQPSVDQSLPGMPGTSTDDDSGNAGGMGGGGDPNAVLSGGGDLSDFFGSLFDGMGGDMGGLQGYGDMLGGTSGASAASAPASQPAAQGQQSTPNMWDQMNMWKSKGLPPGTVQFDSAGNPTDAQGNSLA